MAYFLNLFSPETFEAFMKSNRTISGFRPRQRNAAAKIRQGDHFICYVTRVSRWVGLLEVVDGPFTDDTAIFYPDADPFTLRFKVRPVVLLPIEKAIPIHDDTIWQALSFTVDQDKNASTWTGKIRSSLVKIDEKDGSFLESALRRQLTDGVVYPLSEKDERNYKAHLVRRADKDISVSVPEDQEIDNELVTPSEVRESIRVQALLAEIGTRMGMQIWLPRSDRSSVIAEWRGEPALVLDRLPLNYDDTTLRTIEQIDVLWLKGRAIRRAFEIEHTTSVYSGILRMADLLALQPNMDIRLHIVAPDSRREKVFQEIRRPVFSLLDRGPLSENCTFLSYQSVRELAHEHHLSYLSDDVLDEYEESAED